MKKLTFALIVLLSLVFLNNLYSQQIDTTLKHGWTASGIVGANFTQISFTDWSQGGQSSFSLSGLGNFGLFYRNPDWFFANRLKLAYGRAKSDKKYFTTDNELRLENILIRNVGWKINPYVSNEVRTGLANGFDYSVSPEQQVSAFFDPGYLTQSIGFIYETKKLSSRLGMGFQETFTNKFTKYTDDPGTTEIEKFKFETGIESVTELNLEFMKNMIYSSRLRLFSRFKSLDVWDVNWDNIITARVNNLINVNFQFNAVYQKDQSLKTQIKEALQIGISYILF